MKTKYKKSTTTKKNKHTHTKAQPYVANEVVYVYICRSEAAFFFHLFFNIFFKIFVFHHHFLFSPCGPTLSVPACEKTFFFTRQDLSA